MDSDLATGVDADVGELVLAVAAADAIAVAGRVAVPEGKTMDQASGNTLNGDPTSEALLQLWRAAPDGRGGRLQADLFSGYEMGTIKMAGLLAEVGTFSGFTRKERRVLVQARERTGMSHGGVSVAREREREEKERACEEFDEWRKSVDFPFQNSNQGNKELGSMTNGLK
ncbi:uncharacterized protein MKZ38_001000 [Zalerion maritima]|uniref:Uncharacterized protein n=1 Tax=Zalerion maritima TaxID=339359 RepID=A0AAD5RF15_9PEZI|nr:uncharacterized protein MKZ38_001000 [Zalerion maritima]